MEVLVKRLLVKLGAYKGIEDTTPYDFFVETTVYNILDYCHIEVDDWPLALDNTAVLMADDLYTESKKLSAGEGEVTSLTEGDFSITKETSSDVRVKLSTAPLISKDYKHILNRHRKLAR